MNFWLHTIYLIKQEHVQIFLWHLVTGNIIDDFNTVILFSDNASEYKFLKTLADLNNEHQFGTNKKIIRLYKVNLVKLGKIKPNHVGGKTRKVNCGFHWLKNQTCLQDI